MIRYTFITLHYHYLRFVCLFLFLCLFAFLFAVFNAGVMSHQHLEPKRLGSALAAGHTWHERGIHEYTDYWTVRTRHPAERGASIPEKSDPRVAIFGNSRFTIGSWPAHRIKRWARSDKCRDLRVRGTWYKEPKPLCGPPHRPEPINYGLRAQSAELTGPQEPRTRRVYCRSCPRTPIHSFYTKVSKIYSTGRWLWSAESNLEEITSESWTKSSNLQTRANVLIDNALWAPLFTHTHSHMHTHTSITLYAPTRHSTCTYAAVLHAAASTQSSQHAFLYQNVYDALTYTLTYPHSHLHSHSHHNARRHKHNLTRNHLTTLANQQQEQSQSHSHPLL